MENPGSSPALGYETSTLIIILTWQLRLKGIEVCAQQSMSSQCSLTTNFQLAAI